MTADLPPEVEDKAERAASVAYAVAMNHGYNNPFRGVVDAVAEPCLDFALDNGITEGIHGRPGHQAGGGAERCLDRAPRSGGVGG